MFAAPTNATGGNVDRNPEIFLLETASQTLSQLTSTTDRRNLVPEISGDGRLVVFRSIVPPAGSFEGETEIVLLDTLTGALTPLVRIPTTTDFTSLEFSMSGTALAFTSEENLTAENPDGNREVFLLDVPTRALTQVTRTTGVSNGGPSLNGDGTLLAFSSDGDLTGENAGGNTEVFLFDTATGTIAQLTDTTDGYSFAGDLSDDDTRIPVTRPSGIGDGQELFLLHVASRTLTPVTAGLVGSGRPLGTAETGANGTRFVFSDPTVLAAPISNGILLAKCGAVVNDVVSLTALPDTFQVTSDSSLCRGVTPGGPFSFVGRLESLPGSPPLTDLQVRVRELAALEGPPFRLHRLGNADGFVAASTGGGLTVPRADGYGDGVLEEGETVDVLFQICFGIGPGGSAFRFIVDVLGQPAW